MTRGTILRSEDRTRLGYGKDVRPRRVYGSRLEFPALGAESRPGRIGPEASSTGTLREETSATGDRPWRPGAVRGRRAPFPLRARSDLPLRETAVLPAPAPAPDGGNRLLLAAGGGVDRPLRRHGSGAAELHRVLPLLGREHDTDRRGPLDHPRVGARAGRPHGGRPGRRGDGGGNRHHAGHRADRRARPRCRPIRTST